MGLKLVKEWLPQQVADGAIRIPGGKQKLDRMLEQPVWTFQFEVGRATDAVFREAVTLEVEKRLQSTQQKDNEKNKRGLKVFGH